MEGVGRQEEEHFAVRFSTILKWTFSALYEEDRAKIRFSFLISTALENGAVKETNIQMQAKVVFNQREKNKLRIQS